MCIENNSATSVPNSRPFVIPAQAGIHGSEARAAEEWVPAFAGATMIEFREFGNTPQEAAL